jgi:hypothetical protein
MQGFAAAVGWKRSSTSHDRPYGSSYSGRNDRGELDARLVYRRREEQQVPHRAWRPVRNDIR